MFTIMSVCTPVRRDDAPASATTPPATFAHDAAATAAAMSSSAPGRLRPGRGVRVHVRVDFREPVPRDTISRLSSETTSNALLHRGPARHRRGVDRVPARLVHGAPRARRPLARPRRRRSGDLVVRDRRPARARSSPSLRTTAYSSPSAAAGPHHGRPRVAQACSSRSPSRSRPPPSAACSCARPSRPTSSDRCRSRLRSSWEASR